MVGPVTTSSEVLRPRSVAFATVALATRELRRSWWTRAAWISVVAIVGVVLAAAEPRSGSFDRSSCLEWLALGLRASVRGVGCAIALGAAGLRVPGPRRDGLDWLYAERGISESQRSRAQFAATCMLIAIGLGAPWGAASLGFAWVARDLRVAAAALSVSAFSLVVGAVLGALATACAELFEKRGRMAFIALLVGSWLVEEVTGGRVKSLFRVFDEVLTVIMGAA